MSVEGDEYAYSGRQGARRRGSEARLIRQRQYGPARRSHVRGGDLVSRFPGLWRLVAD
ncbi:hypothetical protein [Streptomyces iconiensis]|uniref:hypothetical protein n=1 Tax=Streptomyces iconiensis TaxID=1384038 RepID=UPI003D2F54F5